MMMQQTNEEQVYFNPGQLKVIEINAKKTFVICGRGWGKSTTVMAKRQEHLAHVMPKGSFLFVGESYKKIVKDLLPKLMMGWNRLGYVEGVDYVNREAPKAFLKFPKPHLPVEDYSTVISWYTGAVLHLVSQDRNASAKNGIDCDAIDVDECKMLDWLRYKTEISPTRRGAFNRWGHLAEYGSEWFYTDKYIGKNNSDWFMQFKDKATPELVELIAILKYELNQLIKEAAPAKQIAALEKEIREYQRNCIHYYEASSLENIDILRYDYFKEQSENLTPTELLTAIFNEDIKKIEGGFYFLLDEYLHGYRANDYTRIDSSNFNIANDFSCLDDADLDLDAPLEIGVDWGGNFNCVAVLQQQGNRIKLLKNFWVETPQKYEDMFEEVKEYYRFMRNRDIFAYTGHDGDNDLANSKTTFNDDLIRSFSSNSNRFNVYLMNAHQGAIPHNEKYKIWKKVLDLSRNRDDRFPTFQFNLDNAYEGYVSMARAGIKVHRVGNTESFKKDKSSENPRINANQLIATHLSDAIDNVVCFKCRDIGNAHYNK
jgi:hypothetical protein